MIDRESLTTALAVAALIHLIIRVIVQNYRSRLHGCLAAALLERRQLLTCFEPLNRLTP